MDEKFSVSRVSSLLKENIENSLQYEISHFGGQINADGASVVRCETFEYVISDTHTELVNFFKKKNYPLNS